MPTYVYKFIDTGETIEVQQAFTDDALTHAEHPSTGEKMQVKKVFTPVGVTFKGGGFYKTDSRGGKSKSSSSSTSSESSSGTSTSGDSSSSSTTTTTTATPAAPSTKSTLEKSAPAKSSANSD
jgi:predicted nucleic acid-binding Zn ribbon protein